MSDKRKQDEGEEHDIEKLGFKIYTGSNKRDLDRNFSVQSNLFEGGDDDNFRH